MTTIEKTPGDIILQGLRGFLINHRKFVQHTPNPCAETACSLRPYNSDSKGRWFESSRAYKKTVSNVSFETVFICEKSGELKPDLTTTEHFVIRLSYLSSYLQHFLQSRAVPSRFMRKFICRLRLSEVSRQYSASCSPRPRSRRRRSPRCVPS